MSYKEWSELHDESTEKYTAAYLDFIYNPENVGNCKECPHNEGCDGHEANGHPCGQQRCWVVAHVVSA